MGLVQGVRLGPYEILSPLGAGGMGEVYRARDTRLERTVAIKVLNSALVASPDLKARFEREAKVVSQLQHPHICVLHDIGSESGTDFLVMEFLDGESLADRLRKGPLPAQELLKIAIEVADALEKAHRAGVVHRDLKPGNVMLTKAGAKLLDFGLAKPFAAGASAGPGIASAGSVFSAALTQSSPASPLSTAGAVIGTVQYMSPEQIQGCEADVRSDIFAFGLMLYEMATGKRAFEGRTQASIVGQILAMEPPPVRTLRANIPAGLERAINICLEKEPDERFQTAHDLKLDLCRIAEAPGTPVQMPDVAARKRWLPWTVAAAFGVVASVLAVVYVVTAGAPRQSLHAYILPPPKSQFVVVSGFAGPPVISRDGSRIAFVATRPEATDQLLWVQSLKAGAAQPLAGTEGAMYPFWSYDGRYLGFFADGKLKKIDANGAPPQALCDAVEGRGGSWNQDDVILFTPTVGSGLFRIPSGGGTPLAVTQLDTKVGETSHRWPEFLPDGKHFIFWIQGAHVAADGGVFAGALDSTQYHLLVRTESSGGYADPGYLLFVRDNTLLAQKLNPRTMLLAGDAVPVAGEEAVNTSVFRSTFTVSANGTLVYMGGGENSANYLMWYDREGKKIGLAVPERAMYRDPVLSPDGKRLALSIKTGSAEDLWIIDLQRQTKTRLTFGPERATSPVWSPDGKWIYYEVFKSVGYSSIYRRSSDGSGSAEPLLDRPGIVAVPASASTDGKYLAYAQRDAKSAATRFDVYVLPLFGDRKPIPQVTSAANEILPQFSPDGKWLAYTSNETGLYEVYVKPFPAGSGKYQASAGNGTNPHWRSDGHELFFRDAGGNLKVTPVRETGEALEFGAPRQLLKSSMTGISDGPFVATSDGKRLLVNEFGGEASAPLTVITNWTELLKK